MNNAGIAKNLFPHPLPSPGSPQSSHDQPPPTPPRSPKIDEPQSQGLPSIKGFQKTLWDCGSPDDWAATFATNVTSVYYTTVAFLDLLYQGNARRQRLQAHSARIPSDSLLGQLPYQTSQVLTVSSSGGFRIDARVLSPSYTVAKAACTHMGKMLSNLLAPWGIRSNVLAPGVFPSGKSRVIGFRAE